jgi:hypothetical protein
MQLGLAGNFTTGTKHKNRIQRYSYAGFETADDYSDGTRIDWDVGLTEFLC